MPRRFVRFRAPPRIYTWLADSLQIGTHHDGVDRPYRIPVYEIPEHLKRGFEVLLCQRMEHPERETFAGGPRSA